VIVGKKAAWPRGIITIVVPGEEVSASGVWWSTVSVACGDARGDVDQFRCRSQGGRATNFGFGHSTIGGAALVLKHGCGMCPAFYNVPII